MFMPVKPVILHRPTVKMDICERYSGDNKGISFYNIMLY